MSVPNQIPESNYVGNGTTTTFAANFEYASDSDVFVTVNGIAPEIGQAAFANGVFTFTTAPANGAAVRVYRSTPIERDTEYDNHDNVFRPRVVNIDFDRIWFVLQEYLLSLGITNARITQEIADRIQADAEMMNYILNEDNELKADYILRDENLKKYIDQTIGAIIGNPDFQGIEAQFVKDASGKNQQEINDQVFYITQSDYVNPMQFKNLLKNAVLNYNNILIKNGEYFADISDGISIKPNDGTVISFQPNARITVTPNNLERVYLFDLLGKKNVTFNYPTCVGDKYTHLGTTGQWGHCFNLESCENVIINQPNISKFWGDGIYVKNAKNCKIFNPVCYDNRRQGLSIISCDGMELFYPQFIDTSGQAPAYGIDIEPNWNGESTKGLKIYNPTFRNNGTDGSYQAGMAISTHRTHLSEGSASIVDTVIDIEIFNPKFYSDAMIITAYNDTVKGSLTLHNPEFYNARRAALYFINHQSDNFKTVINNPKIYDAVSLSGVTIYDNPITFECNSNAVKTSNGTQNVEINNPEIYASDTAGSKRFAIRNVTPNTFPNDMRNVAINNLKVAGFTAAFSNNTGNSTNLSTLDTTFKLTYSDQSVLSALGTGSSITRNMERFANIYTAATVQGVYYLADDILINGAELYHFNLSSNNSAVLVLRFGSSAAPTQAYVEGLSPSKLTTGVVVPRGSFVRLRKLASDRWLVVTGSPNVTTIEAFGVSATYDPPSLAAAGTAGDTVTTTVTVTGAAVGDLVQAAFNRYNAAIDVTASVSAANTVTVKFKNTSAAAVDLPSGTLTVKII